MNRTRLSAFQRPLRRWLLGLALLGAGFAASAQQGPPPAIARLNLQQGTVNVSPAGQDGWYAARPDRALAVGDRLWTGDNARAEVNIGPALLRLDGDARVDFTGVDEDFVHLTVNRGDLQLRVRGGLAGQRLKIHTGNLYLVIGAPGDYRIAAEPSTTWVAVAAGNLTLYGDSGRISQLLTERQQTTVSGRNLTTVRTTRSQDSSFDAWVAERNRLDDRAGSARFGRPTPLVPALVSRQPQVQYSPELQAQQEQLLEQQRATQAVRQQIEWQQQQQWRQQEEQRQQDEWRQQEDWRQQREWQQQQQQRRDWRQRAEQDRWQQQQQQQQLQLQLQQQQQQALRQQQEMQLRAAQAQALQQQQLLQQQQRAAQQAAQVQQQQLQLRQQQELQLRALQMQQQVQLQQAAQQNAVRQAQEAQLRAMQQQQQQGASPAQQQEDLRRLWTSPSSSTPP